MQCPECNASIDGDSRFCKHCGATLQEPADRLLRPASPQSIREGPDIHRDPTQEKPVWAGRPAWRSYYGSWALWALVSVVAIVLAYKYAAAGSWIRTWIWILALGVAVALLVREALIVYSIRYRLTTQRLFIDRGILTRTTDQTELVRVDDVRVRQGVVDRIVGTGDVEVLATDATDARIVLQSVFQPARVAEDVRLHMRAVRGKQTLFVEEV